MRKRQTTRAVATPARRAAARWTAVLGLLALGAACGDEDGGHDHNDHSGHTSCDTAPLLIGSHALSDGGLFRVELVDASPMPPQKHENRWTVRVTDPTGAPLAGLALEVEPYMPEHGHGAKQPPEVGAPEEDGTVTVDRLLLHMGGLWEVRFDGTYQGERERAILRACIEE